MAYKEKKKEVRVFLSSDEHEHLKGIAQEQKISMSELFRLTALKKYKISKSKKPEVAVKCQDDAGCNLSADDEQASLETLSPTSSTPVDDVSIERVETQQAEVEQVSPSVDELLSRGGEYSEAERLILKHRITEINRIIGTARDTGNHLPKDEFQKLCEEKDKLKLIVYPNNVK